MVTDIVSPSGLHGLCSKEQLHLLDAIDSLRSEGINHYISLPQIIVCGDQSSGKSSVLEAISGVSFPVKSNMCTRFPTELVLRKTASSGVNVSIVPHHSRSAAEKESMAEFSGKLEDFKELPNLIENAKAAMGIMALGKAFSNDLLRIEVSGPDRPHLTIVDLPGLIHSENKHQSAADVELIKDVVQGYMQEPRSIILAVVSAKNDYANQVVLKLARSADPAGKRTLGVITKPDTLLAGSGSETMYINLAGNKDVEFRLGWHVLRNADSEADSWTPAQRDAKEAEFFFSGNWQGVSQSNLGIKNLRSRLSKLLLEQISSELPNLIAEIGVKYAQCELKLKGLGQPRTSVEQQRTYLIEISQAFQEIVAAAVNGTYTDPFFDDPVSATGSKRRFRAVIQNLGGQFAEELLDEGRYSDFLLAFRDMPSGSGCEEVEKMVIDIMERGRGRELPGTFSPMIITDLFKKLSSSWEATLESHVQRVWTAAQEFLKDIVEHIADPDTKDAIWEAILMAKLNHNLALLKERVVALMKPHRNGHPITYNMDFQDAFKELQLERRRQPFKLAIDAFFKKHSISPNHRVGNEMNVEELVNDLITRTGWEETCSAGSKAVDMAQAYYDASYSNKSKTPHVRF